MIHVANEWLFLNGNFNAEMRKSIIYKVYSIKCHSAFNFTIRKLCEVFILDAIWWWSS